jgi:hypothetical protein
VSEVSGILEKMSNKNNKISPQVAAIKIYPHPAWWGLNPKDKDPRIKLEIRRPPNKFEG